MATSQELFEDYNYYRAHTQHIYEMREAGHWVRFVKQTPERLASLARMAAWCGERGYDPRHWLCWLFYRGHWRYARPFHQLVPGTKASERKMTKAYKAVTRLPMYERRIRQQSHQAKMDAGQVYDATRDLSATTEALKRRYLRMEDSVGCMDDERTLGYHPRSIVCARCGQAQECEARLQATVSYDIMALRDGQMTAEQLWKKAAVRYAR